MHHAPHAANDDAAFFDLFALLKALAGVTRLPLPALEQLLDAVDAHPGGLHAMRVGQLLQHLQAAARGPAVPA